MQIITNSPQETQQFGAELAQQLHGGSIVLLSGNLGAGKTAMVKGIAVGFGIENEITSPTFTLMNLYEINKSNSTAKTLIHIDTYRLKSAQDLIEIGVEDYLGNTNTVCIIEWPEKINDLLKKLPHDAHKVISISIEQMEGAKQRKILIS
ncbi:MAG: tRNA (adenosine(37)-N6)-threonylcarbamoyltransferase complex ATPase subunit type 1 TsaE [Candidatus Magasanikbacteria bacterium]|nr:tRNA (adenosine(37)-N6)-threonylcarbamoyltransferase complex ATPase subunit type 1 TsaE [Candidatus Magasanikbacteria bacterium]